MDEIEPQTDVDFSRTSILLHVMLTDKLLFIYTTRYSGWRDGCEDGCEGRVESIIRPNNL